ncbi:MAG: HEPN domain-containing protein [Prevotella sp.]|nr:HEPN domain-containing protein [Prevotella sp.]MBQ8114794.1 HEPN domain-containing protein [Prevotella sp.]
MGLNDEERSVIVNLEIEKANNTYSDVLFFINEERWEAAANRLYYAVFHAVSALLIYDGHNIKSHRGIISMFGQHYVKTNLFTRQDGSLLSNLMIMRDNADYNCF